MTGKSRQLSRTDCGGVKDANTLRAQLRVEIEPKGGFGSAHSIAQLFDAVLEHLDAVGREPTTLLGYQQLAARMSARLGKVPLRKLTTSHLDALYAELARGLSSACP